jgi:PAS domain S-box-containing protein
MEIPVPHASPPRVAAVRLFVRENLWILLLAVACFLASEGAILFSHAQQVLAPVWPASGVGLAALLIGTRRRWPAILLTLFLAYISAGLFSASHLIASVGFATANVVESLASAWLISHWCGASVRFSRVNELLALIFCATAVNASTSFLGAGAATLACASPFWTLWTTWWICNGLGMLLVAPLILAWFDFRRWFPVPRWDRMLEWGLFLAIWCAAGWAVFHPGATAHLFGAYFGAYPYMLVALLSWPASRFGQRGVTLALLVLAAIALTSKAVSAGPLLWGGNSQFERLLAVQVYLGFLAVTGLLLSASYTAAVSADQSSREAHARLRALADNLPKGMVYQFVRERDGRARFLYVSAGVEQLTGISAEEVLKDASVLLSLIAEEERPAVVAAQEVSTRDMRVFDIEVRQRRLDGQIRWMQISASPRRLPDGRILWDGIQIDITERKLAEARLREYEKVVEGLQEMVAVVGRDYRYLIANRMYLDYRGLKREQVIGHLVSELNGQETFESVLKSKLDECFQGKVVRHERALTSAGLGRRDIVASYFPIEGPAGIEQIAKVMEDVTERKRAERELQHSHEQLHALTAQLQNVREQERASLAHELQDQLGQTLTAVRIDLAAVKTMPGRDQQLQRIDAVLGMLEETIQRVRKISAELRPGILDDLGLAAALEWGAEEFQARTGIECQVSAPAVDRAIDAQCATALFRIFQETLANIARRAGVTRVGIVLSQDRGLLALEIHDNGHSTGEDQISASAMLGILGMRERASLLGGKLTVAGDPESGTTVRVSIPVADRQPGAASQ